MTRTSILYGKPHEKLCHAVISIIGIVNKNIKRQIALRFQLIKLNLSPA
jgi:hypothetical protein